VLVTSETYFFRGCYCKAVMECSEGIELNFCCFKAYTDASAVQMSRLLICWQQQMALNSLQAVRQIASCSVTPSLSLINYS